MTAEDGPLLVAGRLMVMEATPSQAGDEQCGEPVKENLAPAFIRGSLGWDIEPMAGDGLLEKRCSRVGDDLTGWLNKNSDAGIGDSNQGNSEFDRAEQGQRHMNNRCMAYSEPPVIDHIDQNIAAALDKSANVIREYGFIAERGDEFSSFSEIIYPYSVVSGDKGHNTRKDSPQKWKLPLQRKILAERHQEDLVVFFALHAVFVDEGYTVVIGLSFVPYHGRTGEHEGSACFFCQGR